MDKELKLKIQAQYKDAGIKDLRKALKDVQGEMDNLVKAGKRDSAEFTNLKTHASALSTSLRQLSREYKGLSADANRTPFFLEMGENLTVISAGIIKAFGYLKQFAGVLIDFGKDAVDSFEKSEIASAKLKAGLKNLGETNAFGDLAKQASDLEKISIFSDEDIMNSQAMLTTFQLTSEQIKALTPRLVDIGSAFEKTGKGEKDLQQLAVQIGKVASGSAPGALKKFGVSMTEAQEESLKLAHGMERINILTEILDSNFKGMGEEVGNTFAGKVRQLVNEFDNLKELIGGQIASYLVGFVAILKDMALFIQPIVQRFFELQNQVTQTILNAFGITSQQTIKDFEVKIANLVQKGFDLLFKAIEYVMPSFKAMWKAIGDLVKELSETGLLGMLKKIGAFFVDGLIKGLAFDFNLLFEAIKFVVGMITKAVDLFLKFKNSVTSGVGNSPFITSLINGLKTVWNLANAGYNEMKRLLSLMGLIGPDEAKHKEAEKGTISDTPKTDFGSGEDSNSGGKGKDKDAFSELLKGLKTKIELYKVSNGLEGISLQNALDQLKAGESLTKNEEQRLEYLKEIKKLTDDVANEKYSKSNLPEAGTLPKYSDSGIDPIKLSFSQDVMLNGTLKEIPKVALIAQDAINNLSSAFGAFYQVLQNNGSIGEAFTELLKSILISTINFVEGMILAAKAKLFVDSVLSFGTLLLKELPEILLAVGLAESAKALVGSIGARKDGGPVSANSMYLVGEAGPELIIPKYSGNVISNKNLMSSVLNPNTKAQRPINNIYINANMDGLTFMENNFPKYQNKRNLIKVS